MSLINQMLKDLEQRNAPTGEARPLGGKVRSAQEVRSVGLLSKVLLVLALIAAVVAATVWWKLHRTKTVSMTVSAVPVKPVTTVTASPPPVSQQTEQKELPPAVLVEPSVTETPPPLQRAPMPESRPRKSTAAATAEPAPVKASEPHPVVNPVELTTSTKPEVEPRERHVSKPIPASPSVSLKVVTPQQKSDNLYKQAVGLLQQGRVAEANEALTQALSENPSNHGARQLLAGLMLEGKRFTEALSLLQEGVQIAPEQTGFVMALARLQVEFGERNSALQTLEQGVKYATDNAEYHGFYAALLQRDNRHEEAVSNYLAALRGDPANTSWLIGAGISLQALDKPADAREAFERARQSGQLSPELLTFVEQRLKQLQGK